MMLPELPVNTLFTWRFPEVFSINDYVLYSLSNTFQVLQKHYEEELDLNSLWQNMKEILTSNSQEVVGFLRKRQQQDWITAETWRRIQLRKEKPSAINNSRTRATKPRAQEDHTKAIREVEKSVKMDKRNYINGLAKEAEQAADSGNMRPLYDTTSKLAGKYSKPERPVADKLGRNITGNEQQLNR